MHDSKSTTCRICPVAETQFLPASGISSGSSDISCRYDTAKIVTCSSMQNALTQLKQSTAEIHRKLESCYPFHCFVKNTPLTQRDYGVTLLILYRFHRQTGHYLRALPENMLQRINADAIYAALERDLDILQLPVPAVTGQIDRVTKAGRDERAVAAAYVWLGSSLGAAQITRWLKAHSPSLPRHYYQAMQMLSRHWAREKQQIADMCEQGNVDMNQASNTAYQLFETLIALTKAYSSAGGIKTADNIC